MTGWMITQLEDVSSENNNKLLQQSSTWASSSTMVKTPTKTVSEKDKPHSAKATTLSKYESPKHKTKVIITAVKSSGEDKDLVFIKVHGSYTYHLLNIIKSLCNNKGLITYYGVEPFKPFANLKALWDKEKRDWIIRIGEEVDTEDGSKGKNFPKAAHKFFIKKFMLALIHVESDLTKEDIELADDHILTESDVKYYDEFFNSFGGGNGNFEKLAAQEDPDLESLF
jgi:hypothetical protein